MAQSLRNVNLLSLVVAGIGLTLACAANSSPLGIHVPFSSMPVPADFLVKVRPIGVLLFVGGARKRYQMIRVATARVPAFVVDLFPWVEIAIAQMES